MREKTRIGCVALLSGGLDSMLAAALMKEQGIKVFGVSFDIGFDPIPRKRRQWAHPALKAADIVGIPVEIMDISEEYVSLLMNPPHGYGSAVNPCVDCHTEMVRRAKKYMESKGADFIVTGEVKGQRPMSQRTTQLSVVEKESGAGDILLRPLSAKLLEETLPEREGWVDREKLYGISGRGRTDQIAMAEKMGIDEFPQPAGGCLLADESFAKRFLDMVDVKGKENVTIKDLRLLKAGRHFRLSPELKIIVGRDEDENEYLLELAGESMGIVEAVDYLGPVTVVDGSPDENEMKLIMEIAARYGKGRNESRISIKYRKGDYEKVLDVAPMSAKGPERWII